MKKRALVYSAPRSGGLPWMVLLFDDAEEAHRFLSRYPVLGQGKGGHDFEIGASGSVIAVDVVELASGGWVSAMPSDRGAPVKWPVKS